ncbi:MAG: alanine--tRNA ligase-related protein [Terricaulis sp.]
MKTRLLYLENPLLIESVCIVAAVAAREGQVGVVLDKSPFYPKGGGQPCDVGWLSGSDGRMHVQSVTYAPDRSVVHWGQMDNGAFNVGDILTATIDGSFRARSSRVHSAGEVICAGVFELGKRWKVTAASHAPGQSRVAFACDLRDDEAQDFVRRLEQQVSEIVDRNDVVETFLDVPEERVKELCPLESIAHVPEGEGIRLVSPAPGFFRPCMGAHVSRTGDVGRVLFTKARVKKGELSVTYDVA